MAFRLGAVTDTQQIGTEPAVFVATGRRGAVPSEEARNVSLSATVAESGVVRQFELSYTRPYDGIPRRVTRTFQLRDVGETAVSRPPWFDRAADPDGDEETTATNETTTDADTADTGLSRWTVERRAVGVVGPHRVA